MNKSILNLLCKITIVILFTVGVNVVLFFLPINYDFILSSINNKKFSLGYPGNKIVFIGGSNVLVGIDSGYVKGKYTSGYQPVNMGLYFGYGLPFFLETVKPYVRAGDIYVISPEYDLLMEGQYPNDNARKWCLAANPIYSIKNVYTSQLLDLPRDIMLLNKNKLYCFIKLLLRRRNVFTDDGYVYYKDTFDSYGDPKVEFFKKSTDGSMERTVGRKIDKETIKLINEFYVYCSNRMAKVVFAYPCYPVEEYSKNPALIDSLHLYLQKNLSAPLMGRPQDYMLPMDYFTNSVHHLNDRGKSCRTQILLSIMAKNHIIASGNSLPSLQSSQEFGEPQ